MDFETAKLELKHTPDVFSLKVNGVEINSNNVRFYEVKSSTEPLVELTLSMFFDDRNATIEIETK